MGLFSGLGTFLSERRESRQEFRLARQENRLGARNERQYNRNITRQTGYQNGFDPNAAWAGSVSSLGNSAGGALSAIFGKGSPFGSTENGDFLGNNDGKGAPILLIGAAILAFVLLAGMNSSKQRRRRR